MPSHTNPGPQLENCLRKVMGFLKESRFYTNDYSQKCQACLLVFWMVRSLTVLFYSFSNPGHTWNRHTIPDCFISRAVWAIFRACASPGYPRPIIRKPLQPFAFDRGQASNGGFGRCQWSAPSCSVLAGVETIAAERVCHHRAIITWSTCRIRA